MIRLRCTTVALIRLLLRRDPLSLCCVPHKGEGKECANGNENNVSYNTTVRHTFSTEPMSRSCRGLTGYELAHTSSNVYRAAKDVTGQLEDACNETDDSADNAIDNGVGGTEDGRDQLVEGLEEVGNCGGDGHFGCWVLSSVAGVEA